MPIQTSYAQNMAIAVPGLVVDPLNAKIESRALDSAAGIDAGVFCTHGAAYNRAKLIADSADLTSGAAGAGVAGVVCHRPLKEPIAGNTAVRFAQKDMLAVIRTGEVWVKVQGNIGDDVRDVYVVHEDAGGNLGRIRADAGSGNNEATLVPGVSVRIGGLAGGMALVSLALGPTGPIGATGPEGPAGP